MLNRLADLYGVPVVHFVRDNRAINWEKRKAQIAAYLEQLKQRVFEDGPSPPPVRGDRYTIFDNPWFRSEYYLLED